MWRNIFLQWETKTLNQVFLFDLLWWEHATLCLLGSLSVYSLVYLV